MLMKGDTTTAEIEEKRRKEKQRQKERQVKLKKRAKVVTTGDRLLEDKVYLSMLAEGGIGTRADLTDDYIKDDVAYEAKEALDFLDAREKFWDQLDLNKNLNSKKVQKNGAGKVSVESLRWLM